MSDKININANNRRAKKICSDLSEYVIDSVSFHPYSSEDQAALNVCSITTGEIYAVNGVNDPRMGVSEEDQECKTCFQSMISCTGHSGAIPMNIPIINPRFLKVIISLLKCICNCCGELLIPKEIIDSVKTKGPSRLKILEGLVSNVCLNRDPRFKPCIRNPSFMVKKSKNLHFLLTESCIKFNGDKEKINLPMSVDEVTNILKRISERPDQLQSLGFTGMTKPLDFIIQSFNVIQLCNRSPSKFSGCMDPQDDPLTISYKDLVNKNDKLSEVNIEELKSYKKTETERDIWVHATHIMDNSDGTNKHGKSEPIQGIKERLTQKKGLVRGSQVKRNNYTGRTVAGPSHTYSIVTVEIPEIFRELHTVSEKVTKFNVRKINDLFERGRISSVIYSSGPKKDKAYIYQESNADKFIPPSIGDTVRRWGETGDLVMFGRNPTLSKFSNISAMVRYVDKKTIGIGCPLTKQFNVDFDGDETHLNMMQGIGSRAEARTIMSVKNCIMSFKDCRPNMAMFYNCLSSGFLLSLNNAGEIDDEDWETICSRIALIDNLPGKPMKDVRSRLGSLFKRLKDFGIDKNSPKALFSLCLPEDFNYYSNGIRIKHGIFIDGKISSKNVGCSKKSIVHSLFKNHGSQKALDFITEANYILEYYLYRRGFSITYRDIASSNLAEIQERISEKKKLIQSQIDSKICTESERHNHVLELSNFSDKMVFNNIKETNPLRIMAESGAKGSSRNSMQICGALGQQFMYGKLPERTLTDKKRSSPFFRVGDTDISSTGFIENSFLTGLSPSESFFHLLVSRIGLIDTSVKTSETGHFSRKAHKFLEDYIIEYDGTVRGSGNKIVAFNYFDGFAIETTIQSEFNELGSVCVPVDVDWIVNQINESF